MTDTRVLLVGAGNIAVDYVKVLMAQGVDFDVIGRSESGCKRFFENTGIVAEPGGVTEFRSKNYSDYSAAIIATQAQELSNCTNILLKSGIKRILVEKPAGMSQQDLVQSKVLAEIEKATVFVGYNRRLYSSTKKACEIIEEDGGVTSFNFEFTEWAHRVLAAHLPNGTLDNWLLANSTHVIDLAFFLGGKPVDMKTYSCDNGNWCKENGTYAGAGVTENGALFSYQSNWSAPGCWGVEVLTRKHRLIFRPLEQLYVQKMKSVEINKVQIDDHLDLEYKPGLFREVEALMGSDADSEKNMKTISEQVNDFIYYQQISGRTYSQ